MRKPVYLKAGRVGAQPIEAVGEGPGAWNSIGAVAQNVLRRVEAERAKTVRRLQTAERVSMIRVPLLRMDLTRGASAPRGSGQLELPFAA